MATTTVINQALLTISALFITAGVVYLFYLLRGRRRTTAMSVLRLYGILTGAAIAAAAVEIAAPVWSPNWIKTVALVGITILTIGSSIALWRILPRAIAFQAHENLQEAARELYLSKDRFQRAIDGSFSGLWEWNIDDNTVWYSPRFRELLGYYSEEDFPDTPESWMAAVYPDDLPRVLDALSSHFSEQFPYNVEYRICNRDGEFRWFNARGLAVRNAEGVPYLVSGSIHDIHDRKLAEEAVRRRDEYLNQKGKMEAVGELAGGTAHEFNNMLQAIDGQIQMAEHLLPKSSAARKELALASELVGKSARFTRQLLDLSSPQEVELKPVDVNELVQNLTTLVRPMLGPAVKLKVRLGEKVGAVIADRSALEQALLNLCINSRDAMPDGGELIVSTQRFPLAPGKSPHGPDCSAADITLISVKDTGCGMSEEARAKVFEPYFTTKEAGKGTGLGLALVDNVIKDCKGTVSVESVPGKGSTFSIWLPAVEETVVQIAKVRPPSVIKVPEQHATILYAEDNDDVRATTTQILEQRNHHVLAAADGQEALRLFLDHMNEIDLALLDVVLPRIQGNEVFQYMRKRRPELPILFCSAYGSQLSEDEVFKSVHTRLIDKPFKTESLLEIINEALPDAPHPTLTHA